MPSRKKFKLLGDDYVDLDAFAADMGKDPRTVKRWIAGGLPAAKTGNLSIIHLPTAREWLLAKMQQRNHRR